MGLKFGSEEWVVAYKDALNANKDYETAAATWEGDFVFEVTPDGNLDHEIRFWMDLMHGKALDAKLLTDKDDHADAAFVATGKYSDYLKIINKEIGPIKAIMMRKLKLKGNMAKVMRAVEAAKQLVNTIGLVDTEFY